MTLGTRDESTPVDVGTLWLMHRSGHRTRCALMAWPGDWEVRIIADGKLLLSERCLRGAEAFARAEWWRCQMVRDGWEQVIPSGPQRRPAAVRLTPKLVTSTT